jgi:hypothetical protein
MDVGGTLPLSAMNAVHASFLEVERIRAEPLLIEPPPRDEFTEIPAATVVPKITVAPGATLSEVATASFAAGPPGEEKKAGCRRCRPAPAFL